jgi:hypothetical protein
MGRQRVEDLHGFDTRTAVEFALARVRDAYLNGYDEVEFVHGAANVQERPEEGRGQIKWALRELLDGGRLDAWADRRQSWPRAASLVIALRRNPRPRPETWSPAPARRRAR